MKFGLLGPRVGITLSVNGREYSVGSPIQQLVLAILLLEPGRSISLEAMVDRIWGERPPAKVRGTLSSYVSRLRRELRRAVGDGVTIERRGSTYTLHVNRQAIDLHRCRFLKREALAAAANGDPERAITLWRQRERLWPGDALTGLPGDWVRRMAETLAWEREEGVRARIDLELGIGRHAEVLQELYRLVAFKPDDQGYCAQLMTALYRLGRGGEASRFYLNLHRHLKEAYGTTPATWLKELYQKILNADPGLAAAGHGAVGAGNVPTPSAGAKVARPLRDADPPGGASEEEQVDDPGRRAHSQSHEVDAAVAFSYRRLLDEEKRVFRRLALHPCRDITVAAAAELCDLPPDQVRVLIEVLVMHRVLQEGRVGRYRFDDLVRGHAHELVRAEDSPGEIRRAVTRLLDHYLRRTRAAAAAIRSADAPGTARGGPVDATESRRWLAAEWETVLELARYAAQHEWRTHCIEMTRALTDFLDTEGHWDEAVAAHGLAVHVCRETGDRPGIARASLALGFARFRTGGHAEALTHTREAQALYRSLGDRWGEARCLDQIGSVLWASGEYREALGHYEEARAVYHAAGDLMGEADALGHSGIVYWHLGRYKESLDRVSRALALYQRIGDRRAEAKALNNMGDVYKRLGLHRDAVRVYQQSGTIFEEIAGRQNQAILHSNLGDVHQYKGQYEDALECYRKAIATFLETGDRRNQADILNSMGATCLDMNRVEEALAHFEKAAVLAREIVDSYQELRARMGIGDVHYASGHHLEALRTYEKSMPMARTNGDPYLLAQLWSRVAKTVEYLEGREAARIHWRHAHVLFAELGLPEADDIGLRLRGLGDESPAPV